MCGVWGTLAVGLFGDLEESIPVWGQIGTQALGIVAVFGWVVAASLLIFGVLKAVKGLRVSESGTK